MIILGRLVRPQVILIISISAIFGIIVLGAYMGTGTERNNDDKSWGFSSVLSEYDDKSDVLLKPSVFFLSIPQVISVSKSPLLVMACNLVEGRKVENSTTVTNFLDALNGGGASSLLVSHVLSPPFAVSIETIVGSGSSLLRLLLERALGIYTGSFRFPIAAVEEKLKSVFPGHGITIPSKTTFITSYEERSLSSATNGLSVVLVRHPLSLVMSRARLNSIKIPDSGISELTDAWKSFVTEQTKSWVSFVKDKMTLNKTTSTTTGSNFKASCIILKIESLASDCVASLGRLLSEDLQIHLFNYNDFKSFWRIRSEAACHQIITGGAARWLESEWGVETSETVPKTISTPLQKLTFDLIQTLAKPQLEALGYGGETSLF